MAKIIIDDQEFDVQDDSKFVQEAQMAGVPFGCSEGICGSCRVRVQEGAEHLSELTQEEIDFGFEGTDERLACQCKIKKGTAKLKYF